MVLSLSSSAFTDGAAIPVAFTCDGADRPPPLQWSGVPDGAVTLVVTITDPDAPRGLFHHWAVFDIPPEATGLPAGAGGHPEAVNDFGNPGYGGPCPPRGHGPHRYFFRIAALSGRLGAAPGQVRCDAVIRAAAPLEIASAEIIGRYER